jgi:asparagine synthase (glutamine-hydrolysing)
VLEGLLTEALTAGSVFVSFSGGRDSSALLALAVHVARREGLSLPVPITSRYPGDPDAEEDEWQELVIRHLDMPDWLVLDATGSSDALGAWSTRVLRVVGHNVFPPGGVNAGFRAAHARGGVLIAGEPGDWVLGAHRMTILRHVVQRRGRVGPREWRAAAEAAAPAALRRVAARRRTPDLPWLRPEAIEAHRRAAARDATADPLRWDNAVRSLRSRRFFTMGYPNITAVARAHGTERLDPLGSWRFLHAYAAWGGWRGLPSRTAATRLLCGDLLPEQVLRRRSKASFNRQSFGPATRAFARGWSGAGVDPQLVDADRLRSEWLAERPDGRTLGLLQEAWLAALPSVSAGTR